MRRFAMAMAVSVIALVGAVAFAQQSQNPVGTTGAAVGSPVAVTPDAINWAAAPDALPSGAQFAVLSGDPMSGGQYAVRLKMPDGYKIAPHNHPTDENVTVIQGTFLVGMGDQYSESSMKSLGAGSYGMMPKGMNHYGTAKGETIVQIDGKGPFQITYVNATDDPRNRK